MPITPINGGRGRNAAPPSAVPVSIEPMAWKTPTQFPEHAPSILRRPRLRKKQFPKFTQELALFLSSNLSADLVIALQDGLRRGDKDAIKLMCQTLGLVKNDSGVTVNLQNNVAIQNNTNTKQIDSLVRLLDERDRTVVIDAGPLAVDLAEDDDDDEAEDE